MSTTLPRWTEVAMPHDDVRDEQAVKAEYAVNIGKIDRADASVSRSYADPRAFFEATYLTDDLRRLLTDTMAALSGKKLDRVLQLRTPFGGGKSHSLVAMYHLARSRKDLGSLSELKGIPDPGPVRVAVLSCADLTPGIPRKVKGGPTIQTLWGELAFRLGGAEGYEVVKRIDETPSAPGGELLEGLLRGPKKESTLILADEVLVYVEKAMAIRVADSTLGRQTLTFLQALTETVAGDPSSAFVYSLQASVAEAVGDEGLLQALDKLVGRVDARRVPVQDRQVREIIRRRLFKSLGSEKDRQLVATAYADEYRRFAEAAAETKADRARVEEEAKQFADDVLAAYPFHPSLIRLMYERWGSLPSYQRTRGVLQFLGTVVHVLFKRNHGGALIAPGDVPLDHPDVRSEFFRQIGEREKWDSVLDADVASERARARQVDRRIGEASPALMQARVGSSTATAITLFSFGARKDELRGVVRHDLLAACLRPGVEAPTIDAALAELKESLLHLHPGGGRYRMDTIPSLTKLIEEALHIVEADDVIRKIRETIEELLGKGSTAILWPESSARIPDERREYAFAYLPLEWAENDGERNEAAARAMLVSRAGGEKGGKRRFRNGVAFVLPQKAYADQARSLARRVLALDVLRRNAKGGKVQVSEEQKDELDEKAKNAAKDLVGACRSLYGQVLLPVRGKEGADPIAMRTIELGTLAAGTDPHTRLLDLLKKQVFSEIAVDRFVEILGLGAPSRPHFVPLAEALDSFFSFLDHPKMRSDQPLLEAVAAAVERRSLGYVPAARVEGDQLVIDVATRVRFGRRHEPDEFAVEDGAFLVSGDLATRLEAARRAATSPSDRPTGAGGEVAPPTTTSSPPPPSVLPEPAPRGEKGKRYVLTASSKGKQQWYALGGAVNQLIGASADVVVKIEVNAVQPAGFDPVFLRNRVEEPLDEKDIEHEAVLAKD
jgi:uncharacterized protein DUF499